jgi:hypothetical protein
VDNEGEEDEDDSERSSDLSRDSDGMGDDHDEDDEEASEENSIIDMLEEQQMEADQADEGDGWTTDTDSAEENEEILEEEESNEEEEFGGFPSREFPILDHDADGMNYSEEDVDEGADIEGFREMIGSIEGEFLAPEPDEEEDEEEHDHLQHHHLSWLPVGRTHTIRPNAPHRHEFQFVPPDFRHNARGGLPPQRSCNILLLYWLILP